jgi:hypothetical protein
VCDAAIKVIGSGFPRTGTDSLRVTLEMLGYRTYHMQVILENELAEHMDMWKELLQNDCQDEKGYIKTILEDYDAAVDFPAAACWEEILKQYPDAKIVHTERSAPELWWKSVSTTVFQVTRKFPMNIFSRIVPMLRKIREIEPVLWKKVMNETVASNGFPETQKTQIIAAYEREGAKVREMANADGNVLILDYKQGWEPLCEFLGKPVPESMQGTPLPHKNTRKEFHALLRSMVAGTALILLLLIVMLAALILSLVGKKGIKQKKE